VRIEAAARIVTLPLVCCRRLPNGRGVRFEPPLPRAKHAALEQLSSGPVVKVVLEFARPFWTELERGRYRNAAFFFTPDAPFPTFWTSLPVRSSLLVAWCAGPKAQRWVGKPGNRDARRFASEPAHAFRRRDYTDCSSASRGTTGNRSLFAWRRTATYSPTARAHARPSRVLSATRCTSPGRPVTRAAKRPPLAAHSGAASPRRRESFGHRTQTNVSVQMGILDLGNPLTADPPNRASRSKVAALEYCASFAQAYCFQGEALTIPITVWCLAPLPSRVRIPIKPSSVGAPGNRKRLFFCRERRCASRTVAIDQSSPSWNAASMSLRE
jgi:hypothetical protein